MTTGDVPVIPLRWQRDADRVVRRLTLSEGHPLAGSPCPGCGVTLCGGDRIALVVVGPGDDDERAALAAGRWSTVNGVAAHDGCRAFDVSTLTGST